MKRVIIACFVVFAFALFGCDSATEATPADGPQEINKLETLKQEYLAKELVDRIAVLELGPGIEGELDSIQEAYEALSSDGQDQVENYGDYLDIRDSYEYCMERVQYAIDAIDGIGVIDENSMDAIEAAQAAYDGVNPMFMDLVTNASDLDGAKEACEQAIIDKGVSETQALIDAGKYKDAYNYASEYRSAHMGEVDTSDIYAAMQKAELYWAWELYNQGQIEYVIQMIDDLKSYAANDQISQAADNLESTLESYVASLEPANGTILDATISGGYGTLTINSGSSPLLVKVEGYNDPSRYIYVYLRANSTTTFNVPDGDYLVKYASGDTYYGDLAEKPFGPDTKYKQADDIMEFRTTEDSAYIYYSTITLTLYAVSGGNLGTTTIDGF